LAVGSGIDGHARLAEDRSARSIDLRRAGRFEPAIPIPAVGHVQERAALQVRRRLQCRSTAKIFRAANGKELFGAEPGRVQARPLAVAVSDRQIDVLAGEIDMLKRSTDAQIDLGMIFDEAPEAVHEPFGGEVGRG